MPDLEEEQGWLNRNKCAPFRKVRKRALAQAAFVFTVPFAASVLGTLTAMYKSFPVLLQRSPGLATMWGAQGKHAWIKQVAFAMSYCVFGIVWAATLAAERGAEMYKSIPLCTPEKVALTTSAVLASTCVLAVAVNETYFRFSTLHFKYSIDKKGGSRCISEGLREGHTDTTCNPGAASSWQEHGWRTTQLVKSVSQGKAPCNISEQDIAAHARVAQHILLTRNRWRSVSYKWIVMTLMLLCFVSLSWLGWQCFSTVVLPFAQGTPHNIKAMAMSVALKYFGVSVFVVTAATAAVLVDRYDAKAANNRKFMARLVEMASKSTGRHVDISKEADDYDPEKAPKGSPYSAKMFAVTLAVFMTGAVFLMLKHSNPVKLALGARALNAPPMAAFARQSGGALTSETFGAEVARVSDIVGSVPAYHTVLWALLLAYTSSLCIYKGMRDVFVVLDTNHSSES